MQHVVLGGELRGRGIFSGNHSAIEWAGMAACTVIGFAIVLVGGTTWLSAIFGALLIGAGIGGFTPWPATLGRSPAGWAALWARRRWLRRRPDRSVFIPGKRSQ